MRKALVIGIDYYEEVGSLYGCVRDARAVADMLVRNADGSVNFHVKLLTAQSAGEKTSWNDLRQAIEELFQGDSEIALFYFAGHGYLEPAGGYLCHSDCKTGNDGIALGDIMSWANQSPARNKVILLDSCHSGGIARKQLYPAIAELSDGVTILTASTAEQYAKEDNGFGVFTSLLVDALGGAASNLLGDVTPGSIYAHIDQSLGPWAQRPVFRTNVKRFVSLRKAQAPLDLPDLRRICELFPEPDYIYQLDPAYEPHRSEADKIAPGYIPPDPIKNEIFAILQKYNRVNLLVPIGVPHMYDAAMQSKSCKLTALGEHYRRLAKKNMF